MLLHVALIAEILATVVCLHCIYGKKVKFDVRTVGLILGILVILELANRFRYGGILSLSVYLVLYIYCKSEFKSYFTEIVISIVLYMVILTSLQFICMFISNIFMKKDVCIRNVISNILALIVFIIIYKVHGIKHLQKSICKNIRSINIVLGFLCLIVFMVLIQGKVLYEVQMQYFVFVIPAIVILVYGIIKWCAIQRKTEKLEREIDNTIRYVKRYDDLLAKVRLRQHEFKNDLLAILSTRYIYKSYDGLVRAQEEYCKVLLNENRYNSLLQLGKNILTGYLYGKFQEAEGNGIEIKYSIATAINMMSVPEYCVVEMLGILFDNAIEAIKDAKEKIIYFEILEYKKEYIFILKNPFTYVPYDEILEWFKYEKSEKGNGRGIGLFHLKRMCEEWKCHIGCRNVENAHKNWIEFTLRIGKTDKE